MRLFLACLIFLACPLMGATLPNVVVLLADDAGWGDYSFNGNRQIATPNIDSLAKGGVHFERFFVQPVCSPPRSEFLTGRCHRRLHGKELKSAKIPGVHAKARGARRAF
jgi:hypothetical protein